MASCWRACTIFAGGDGEVAETQVDVGEYA
jgi:hypothetical protein